MPNAARPARPPLPIIPVDVLKKHHCHERQDNRFRSCARLLQACWRSEQNLPVGTFADRRGRKRRIGSLLANLAADAGRNFMTPDIAFVARRTVVYQEPGAMIEQGRLFGNLLSSMPLCFNVFAPLALDFNLAARVLRLVFPGLKIRAVTAVLFEHSPGRLDPDLTGDRSAFDVAMAIIRDDGRTGMIAFEVKYSESLQDSPGDLNPRYDGLAEASGLFKEHATALLRVNPLHQLFREHLLAQAAVMRGDWEEATFVLLAPAANHLVQRGADLYAAHLVPPVTGQVPFVNLTLETFIRAIAQAGATDYANDLHDRYCAWWKLDELVEQALAAKTRQWRLAELNQTIMIEEENQPLNITAKAA